MALLLQLWFEKIYFNLISDLLDQNYLLYFIRDPITMNFNLGSIGSHQKPLEVIE